MSIKPAQPTRLTAATAALALLLALPWHAVAQQQLRIVITGLSGEPLSNVKASLDMEQQRRGEELTADTIRDLHDEAERKISRALEPFGYYRPEIKLELRPPDKPGTPWETRYVINPGQPIPVGEITVQFSGAGANDQALTRLPEQLMPRTGSTLEHRNYEAAKRTLLSQVRELGYLDADYTRHLVEVDLARYTADITLAIETGPRYVFGPIVLEQELFAPEYLAHYLILRPGEAYSQALITRQRRTLSKSGYFQEVTIELGDASNDEQPAIPLHIRLVPFKANRYRGRVGWGTDTDFGVQVDWTRRYLGKHGQRFTLGGEAVQDRNRLAANLSYMIPLDPLSGHGLELAGRHESKDLTFQDLELEEGGDTRIATNLASVFWHQPNRSLGSLELRSKLGLSLVGETYDIFEVLFGNYSSDYQQLIIDTIGRQNYETLSPDFKATVASVRLTAQRASDPLYIKRGDYFNLELLGSEESLGSNLSFWQLRMNTWNIWPAGDLGRILLRSAFGYSDARNRPVLGVNFNEMPEYYEFRAGGARSIRGYGFEELYPADSITGGKHQLVGSIEYEHEIIPDWSVAVFLDGGNAFNEFDDIDPKLGTGFGIHWRSPVGLARIDFGVPLDDAEDSFHVYITVGPEF
jgi:translocation and assembly module TamA